MWKKSKNTRLLALFALLFSSLFSPFSAQGQEEERQQDWRRSLQEYGVEEGSEMYKIATQCIDDMSTEACKKMTIYNAEFLNNWREMRSIAQQAVNLLSESEKKLKETEELLISTQKIAKQRTDTMTIMNRAWEAERDRHETEVIWLWFGVGGGALLAATMTIAYILKQ